MTVSLSSNSAAGSLRKGSCFNARMEVLYLRQLQDERKNALAAEGADSGTVNQRYDYLEQRAKDFYNFCAGRFTWALFGSARDKAVERRGDLVKVLQAFAKRMVDDEFAHLNGGGPAWMDKGGSAQTQAWENDFSRARAAPLLTVPLRFVSEQVTEPPFDIEQHVQCEWLSDPSKRSQVYMAGPQHEKIQTRTGMGLMSLTNSCSMLFLPGGAGTVEEDATDGLARQMRDAIITHYSGIPAECLPQRFYMDGKMSHSGLCSKFKSYFNTDSWFWDWKLAQIRNMLEEGTVSEVDYRDITVVRIGKASRWFNNWSDLPVRILYFDSPEEAAAHIAERTIETKNAIVNHIADSVSSS